MFIAPPQKKEEENNLNSRITDYENKMIRIVMGFDMTLAIKRDIS